MATPVTHAFKSSWRSNPSDWKWQHHILSHVDLWRDDENVKYPVFKKTDPVTYVTSTSIHVWVLYHTLWPVLLHAGFVYYTGKNLPALAAVALYSAAFQLNTIHLVGVLRRVALRLGFLDGEKYPRDQIPDTYVEKAIKALPILLTTRSIMSVFLTYRANEPISFSWWLPAELFFYSIFVDFWFYLYHRSCHEVDGLWQYHRTHHLTKHPSPLLTIYADAEQEAIETVIVPLLAYAVIKLMGFPMGFYDWWVCHQFIAFTEVGGHSGLRAGVVPPGVAPILLKLIGAELMIEDHDLHHRHGWKKSCNYGKQTRLWDMLFGTCGDRIEMKATNIDYANAISMPLW